MAVSDVYSAIAIIVYDQRFGSDHKGDWKSGSAVGTQSSQNEGCR